MISRKSLKQQITETVLKEIPEVHIIHELTIDEVIFKWWYTGRQEGLRLTDEGVTHFQIAEIAYYDFEFKQDGKTWHSFLLEVNKKIKCPYYLGVNKKDKKPYIRIYDSKVAMMMGLYGNLQEYMDSVKERK